jgi:hypothetical protein
MALTVEDLYRQYAGRESDPSGKAFWEAGFGETIDANEVASFINAVAQARAQGTEPAATTANTYFQANPDVAAAYQANSYGLTPEQFASTHYNLYGQAEGRSATPETVTTTSVAPTAPINPTVKLYQDTLGRTPSQEEIDSWNFGSTIEPQELDSFLGAARNEAVDTKPTTGAVGNIAKQILAQGTTDKWSGQGFGSAEKNAYDMAVMLAGQGITDINQFGKAIREVPTYDENGNQTGTQAVTQFINKATGEPINSYYDRAGGDVWGGTFAGKGSTSYGVQFDEQGKPVFYSQYGGSTSDIGQLMPVIQLGLAASGAGGLLGNALLGTGASQIASSALGNAILGGATTGLAGGDVLKGALLGGAGGALSGYLQGGPIDASNMTATQFNDAIENQLISSMQGAGLTNAQINQFLENASAADIASITSALPVTNASDTLLIDAARAPITATDLINTLAQVPTVAVTSNRPEQVSPDVLNAVTSILSGETTIPPEIEITTERPRQPDTTVITPPITPVVTTPIVTTPVVTTPTGTTSTTTDTPLTASDIIRIIGIGTTIAGINAATDGVTTGGVTQYPIINVPTTWTTPPKPSVGPATVLPPINFGDRNLLRGTQWEKFLDPKYGLVPEPIQYSQPSSLSYNDLMGILGSKQGYPAKSSLSINDIISGIQNQYGQARTGTMG